MLLLRLENSRQRGETLAGRPRKRKRVVVTARVPLQRPTEADQLWTMDFTQDALARGRKFRTLNLIDGYTREALAIEVDTSLPGVQVVRVLERLRQTRGLPAQIQVDNSPEFLSQVVDQWAFDRRVKLHFIEAPKIISFRLHPLVAIALLQLLDHLKRSMGIVVLKAFANGSRLGKFQTH
jgi:transposase InsO family protein